MNWERLPLQRPDEILTVSEVTRRVRTLLEEGLGALWVQGEISNFTHHASGHMYFSLKDEASQLRCVMFRGQNRLLKFTPEGGMLVRALGRIGVYEQSGLYQLYVEYMETAGRGALEAALRELQAKLQREGLFGLEHKQQLPPVPFCIGVVTSITGAAVRDIVQVSRRRFPGIHIVIRPALVQGEGAAADIARAIEEINAWGGADVLIVGRGGGSLEDLWAFNEEAVVRAIFASEIPVVSAVGHEVDVTLSDLVADVRAPTPSAAAEIVVPQAEGLLQRVQELSARRDRFVRSALTDESHRLQRGLMSYGIRSIPDRLRQGTQELDESVDYLQRAAQDRMRSESQTLEMLTVRLDGLDPRGVLRRGYSISRTYPEREVVREAGSLTEGQLLETLLHLGAFRSRVEAITDAGETGAAETGASQPREEGGSQ